MENYPFARYDPFDPDSHAKIWRVFGRARAKGGSSSGSGAVDYPAHMKTFHQAYIGSGGTYALSTAWSEAVSAAPYAAELASPTYTPTEDWIDAEDEVVLSKSALTALVDPTSAAWDVVVTALKSRWDYIGPAQASGLLDTLTAEMEDQLDNIVLPKFRRGMQDIGAHNTSAFTIGEALLRAQALKQVSDKQGEVETKLVMQQNEFVFKDHQMGVEWNTKNAQMRMDYAKLYAEMKRVLIVGKMEWAKTILETSVQKALWKMELSKYVNDAFGSIHGAPSTVNAASQKSQLGSAIGGGISGAAAGAAVGSVFPGVGTVTGAVVGGALGIGSSFL